MISRQVAVPSRKMIDSCGCLDVYSSADADIAQLGIELQRMDSAFASDARLLRAPERRAQIAKKPRVDPHDAGIDGGAHAETPADIARPHRLREPVRRVVGEPHRLFLAVEGAKMTARTEDFLAHDRG